MKLSIGIVGLPNVGKSSLFTHLTKQQVTVANYPFATIDPNVGIVSVPDERLGRLSLMSRSKKTVPAVVEFYDIAGLVRGASSGEGLGNQFLAHIRDVQAIAHVVRAFPSPEIIHVEEGVDPLRDIGIIHTELILRDLESVSKRRDKLEKEAKSGDVEKSASVENLRRLEEELGKGVRAILAEGVELDDPVLRELNLLTAKREIFVVNGSPSDLSEEFSTFLSSSGSAYVVQNLAEETDLTPLIREAYASLGLASFFTTGEDETRAWTIYHGSRAPQAAGAIHTDFERTFIRAEVIDWESLLAAGSWAAARQKGLIRIEGKEYVVRDGDVMVIRHG